jgi:serine/threonine protein kinase
MEVSLQSFRKRFTYDPVKDLLGKGGFAEVFKAYDNEDHLFVAIKIAQGITDDKYNLINEIKRFKKLNHPNIVKHIEAYEVNTGGTDIHGNPIIHHVGILEYADQGTFADLLKKGTNYRQIEDIAKDIIEGLAYLHSEGIIHRDLKPSNILLFKEGEKLRAKITDFGIAKRADATAASTQLVGTVEYMAPEYFTTGNITTASDVWSVGVMLLEALTGSHPFGKTTQGLNNQQIINQILNKDISSAIQPLNAPFKDMITRCLLREVALRPQSAESLKGLSQEGGDAFTESTQILGPKTAILSKETQEPKWKRWRMALFDFDVSNGRWRKVLARELVTSLLIFLASVILPLFLYVILMGVSKIRVYPLKTQRATLQLSLDSIENITRFRPYEFSKAYFKWGRKDTSGCYTPIGAIYRSIGVGFIATENLPLQFNVSRNRIPLGNLLWDDQDVIQGYRTFVSKVLKAYTENHFKNEISGMSDLELLEQTIKTAYKDNNRFQGYNIISEITSVSNLTIEQPFWKDGVHLINTDYEVYTPQVYFPYPYVPFYYLPSEIVKRINQEGWVEWFFKYRVDSLPDFKSYLEDHDANDPEKFRNFMVTHFPRISGFGSGDKYLSDVDLELNIHKIDYKIESANELWGLEKYAKTGELFGLALAILLFIFYPIRILVGVILWSVKILRQS